jgi:hypothetical protein
LAHFGLTTHKKAMLDGMIALRVRLAGARFRLAAIELQRLLRKAKFDPNQPRVPRGRPDGGRWTEVGAEGGPGKPPMVPAQRPPTARMRNAIVRAVARWLRFTPLGRLATLVEVGSWLYEQSGYITAYLDAPKSLEELQRAVADRRTGYDVHHIVEQTPARQDGFGEGLIEGRDNLVRVPTLKHWELTAWFNTKNKDYGGLSPRNFLRGQSWEERRQVGLQALIVVGALKP